MVARCGAGGIGYSLVWGLDTFVEEGTAPPVSCD